MVSYRIPGTRNHKYARFPSPLEVWVVSYELKDYLGLKTTKCFRPLSRYGWFPTTASFGALAMILQFPSPLEVWVVSYQRNSAKRKMKELFPSPLEVWVVSYTGSVLHGYMMEAVSVPSRGMGGFLQDLLFQCKMAMYTKVSVPSRGMGGFLPHILYPKRETIHKIVPPWKLS